MQVSKTADSKLLPLFTCPTQLDMPIMLSFVEYAGHKVLVRRVKIWGEAYSINVASLKTRNEMLDEDGEPLNIICDYLDQQIGAYVSTQSFFHDSDDELERYVNEVIYCNDINNK